MTRHELDLMSLLPGLFFTLLGLGFVLSSATPVRLDAEWVLPIALIGAGVAGLVGSFVSARSDTTTSRTAADAAHEDPEHDAESRPAEHG